MYPSRNRKRLLSPTKAGMDGLPNHGAGLGVRLSVCTDQDRRSKLIGCVGLSRALGAFAT